MEQQAFARVHRIGQKKRVHTVKLIVQDSVDERVLEIQDRKEANIAQVQEGSLVKKLSNRELSILMLRGKTIEDLPSGLDHEGIDDGENIEVGHSDPEDESGSSDEGSEYSDTEQALDGEDSDLFD